MTNTDPTLAQRVQNLEDLNEIKKLKAHYAEALDARFDGDRVSALFCEDGTWLIGEERPLIIGRQAIKEHCDSLKGSISWSIHYFMPSVIEIDDDGQSAEGSFYILDFQTLKDESGTDQAYMFAGTFNDRFAKVDGRWLFREVRGKIDVVAPWTESWVNDRFVPDFFAKEKAG